jgi:DNA repair exonuclease SbcCD ATPase subunit
MAKKKIEKRKFIESIFNLEIFSDMNSNLKVEMLDAKKDLEIKNSKCEEAKNYYNALELQNKNKEEEKQRRKVTLIKRKEENDKELESIADKLGKIQSLDLKSVEEKISLAENKVSELTGKINSVGKDISTIETKKDYTRSSLLKIGTEKDTCPVCLKQVTADDKNHIADKKQVIKDEIKVYEGEIKSLESKLEVYELSKAKLKDAISKLKDIVNKQNLQNVQKKHLVQKQKDIVGYNNDIAKDIEDLEKTNSDFSNILKQQKDKLDALLEDLEKDKHNINLLDYVKFVLSEDGVRSYIVKKILVLFNNKLSYYLRKLNSNAFIKFDEFFEDTIVNSKDVLTSYFNYSGAEKKVIDLAIMFTFIEMLRLQSNVIYNIQFYDELLDTSLDEAGVELVVKLLNEISQQFNYGIYIISHRKECSKLSTGEVIFLEKREGITKRIPFEG